MTRQDAIILIVRTLTRQALAQGQELADYFGTDLAAAAVVEIITSHGVALEAVGISRDEVQAIADRLEAEQRV